MLTQKQPRISTKIQLLTRKIRGAKTTSVILILDLPKFYLKFFRLYWKKKRKTFY